MTTEQLLERTKKFSLQIILFFRGLPKGADAQILGRQLLRSATSVTANYRAACRARSKREFVAKLSIVVEEADETLLWIELIEESKIATDNMDCLKKESRELLYIFSASRKSATDSIKKSTDHQINK